MYDVPTDTLINEKVVDGEMVTTMKYENFYKGIDTNRIVHADDRDAVTGMFRKILDADADSCDRLMGDLRLDLDGGGKCESQVKMIQRNRSGCSSQQAKSSWNARCFVPGFHPAAKCRSCFQAVGFRMRSIALWILNRNRSLN